MNRGNKKSGSLFLRILVVFLLVNMTTGSVLIFLGFGFSREAIEKRTKQHIAQQIAIIRSNFENQFKAELGRSLRALASASALDDYLLASDAERLIVRSRLERLFVQTLKDHPRYHSASFVDVSGEMRINVVGKRRERRLLNLKQVQRETSDKQYSPADLASGRLFASLESIPLLLSSGPMEWFMPRREMQIEGPFRDENGKIMMIAGLAIIDLNVGAFAGVVIIRQWLDEFFAELRDVRFFDENQIWISDAQGRVLQQPKNPRATFDPTAYLDRGFQRSLRMLDVDEGIIAYEDFSLLLGKPSIRIAIAIPSSLLLKDVIPAVRFFTIVLLASFVVVFVVAFYFSRHLSQPIIELASAATRLAKGDLTKRVDVKTSGEVQLLVDSFNRMTDQLQESMVARDESLESLTNEVRERRLAERRLKGQTEELIQARITAEEADRAKSEFLAAMSHELRTPLNAILGFSEIIKEETLGPVGNPRYRDYAKDIHGSGRHLLSLINDILDLSKIESGAEVLHEEDVSVPDIANAALRLVRQRAEKAGVEFKLDLGDELPLLRTDERMVKQILLNLLSNAIKFTPRGGKVTVKIWSRAESGYVFQVTDTGIGIAVQDIPKALAPFQQIDSGLNRKHDGTGLGLPLTKSLVEMHGGSLDLQSMVGVGTTVTVRFPAERIVRSPRDTEAVGAADKKAG